MEIIAHRGIHKNKSEENTIGAFNRAVLLKCEMLELDCRLTQDRELVVSHDPYFTLSDNTRVYIQQNTLKDLQNKVGAVIPLEFVLGIFTGAIKINVELKDKGCALVLCKLLEKFSAERNWSLKFMKKNLVVSSFVLEELVEFKSSYPYVGAGLLRDWGTQGKFETKTAIYESLKKYGFEAVHLSVARATKRTVKYFKNLGFKVRVYMVNDLKTFKKYKERGVDGVFTDKVEEFLKA
ncbi:MAG: glycerophosphodiester phosphodiesterase [Candidatus Yanofskybacteria bacterium]|nr:glycerophosphodiester phosphodiesterase [Candidatus Yanofskybacteria bacterium]